MGQRKKKTANSIQAGSYFLEFSVAIIGVVGFILAIADVSRMYHARAAVKAGVTAALRCLYPTDAGCLTAGPGGGSISPSRFNAWVWGSQGFRFPRSSVVLNASWYNEPVVEVPVRERQLLGVDVVRERTPYRNFSVLFPIDAHAPYLLKVRDLPRLDGTNPLNPVFLNRATGQVLPPTARGLAGDRVIRLQNVGLNATASTNWVPIGSVSFSMSDAWSNQPADSAAIGAIEGTHGVSVPCYQGGVAQGSTGAVLQWPATGGPQQCQYRTATQNLLTTQGVRVPLLFRLSGSRNSVSAGAQGEVRVRMVFTNLQGERRRVELGGRTFSDSGSVDFLVRGARRGVDITRRLARAYDEARYDELDLYGDLPMVPLTSDVRLDFFVRKIAGTPTQTVGWRGEDLQLFYPRFEFVHEVKDCGYSVNPSVCANTVLPVQPLYSDLDLGRTISSKPVDQMNCQRFAPNGTVGEYGDVMSNLQGRFKKGGLRRATSFLTNSNTLGDNCTPQTVSADCSDEPTEVFQGCEDENPPANIEGKCAIESFDPTYDSISDVHYKVNDLDVTEARGTCTDEVFPACTKPHQVQRGEQFLGNTNGSCADSRRVVTQPFSSQPFFNNTCTDISARFVEQYRQRHQVPDEVDVPVLIQTQPAVYSAVAPTDSCQEFEESGDGDTDELLCASASTRGVARRCCERHEGRCRLEALPTDSFGGDAGTGADGLLTRASERAIETIQAAYPSAQSGVVCEAGLVNCIQIETALVNDETEAQVRASVAVPMSILGWLGFSEEAVIESEQTRILESSLTTESY